MSAPVLSARVGWRHRPITEPGAAGFLGRRRAPVSAHRRVVATPVASARAEPHQQAHEPLSTSDWHIRDDDIDEEDTDDLDALTSSATEDEFEPPPLPASVCDLLSEVISSVAAQQATASDSFDVVPPVKASCCGGHAAGAKAAAYRRLTFCTNCCRPLSDPQEACTGCGHRRSHDAEILGDPRAWAEAYAAQLTAQQAADAAAEAAAQAQVLTRGKLMGSAAGGGAGPAGGRVLLAADERMLLHRTSLPPYPGRPERLQAIMSRLHSSGLMSRCRLLPCRPANELELLRVHSPALIAAVRAMPATAPAAPAASSTAPNAAASSAQPQPQAQAAATAPSRTPALAPRPTLPPSPVLPVTTAPAAVAPAGSSVSAIGRPGQEATAVCFCPDTLYNSHTRTAALLAAGAAADVGSALAAGRVDRAMAVLRPPGAQAGVDVARGGCYLNNIAVAAAAALAGGAQKVMVVDWDVHHGRGTAEIFADDPRVLVLDMHRYDSDTYPGSGAIDDVGLGRGEGFTLNVAFGSAGVTDGDLLSAALHVVLPVAHQFRPGVVLVAAGFGALKGDPVGGCSCSPAVFAHLTHLLASVGAPVGLLLEGGYNLDATAAAVEGCARVLLGEAPPPLPGPWATTGAGWLGIMNAMQIHSQYWSALHPLSFNGWAAAIDDQERRSRTDRGPPAAQHQAQEEAVLDPEHSTHHGHHHGAGHHHGTGHDQHAHTATPQPKPRPASPPSASFGALSGPNGGWEEAYDPIPGSGSGSDSEDEVDTAALAAAAAMLRERRNGGGVEPAEPEADPGWAHSQGDMSGYGEAGADVSAEELLDAFLGSWARGPGSRSFDEVDVAGAGVGVGTSAGLSGLGAMGHGSSSSGGNGASSGASGSDGNGNGNGHITSGDADIAAGVGVSVAGMSHGNGGGAAARAQQAAAAAASAKAGVGMKVLRAAPVLTTVSSGEEDADRV
ncbi:hypothetical protein HYH03_004196 [Edaphochlamys debaryana]|uniref:Histone deacetylase domain-containing protein n=1 Tax=Edaphochlamys debaryana TaxID=47281 RepID=A0A836C3Q5_9CHLO|nr:hypothetical protein HYH03_004196 [Edaphochlamys debaryana]|eukprot:KAG2497934.1 hypothetical protein HYH03_004196 [Edaphochlamys debaryana]